MAVALVPVVEKHVVADLVVKYITADEFNQIPKDKLNCINYGDLKWSIVYPCSHQFNAIRIDSRGNYLVEQQANAWDVYGVHTSSERDTPHNFLIWAKEDHSKPQMSLCLFPRDFRHLRRSGKTDVDNEFRLARLVKCVPTLSMAENLTKVYEELWRQLATHVYRKVIS